jgi:hypothetical protein
MDLCSKVVVMDGSDPKSQEKGEVLGILGLMHVISVVEIKSSSMGSIAPRFHKTPSWEI